MKRLVAWHAEECSTSGEHGLKRQLSGQRRRTIRQIALFRTSCPCSITCLSELREQGHGCSGTRSLPLSGPNDVLTKLSLTVLQGVPHTVIHFYFGSVQFSVKRKFAVSVRRKFRWREMDPEQAAASVNPELKFR